MIGIVIVSHSAQLAEGVVELARQMGGPDVPIVAAGGIQLSEQHADHIPEFSIGTDAMRVSQAIAQVYSDDGVLVLVDMGSAVMSTEIAIELLDPAQQPHIRMIGAPLVEGAIAAAVQARLGASLARIAAEAEQSLAAKRAQFPDHTAEVSTAEAVPADHVQQTIQVTVTNPLGLHARPAARIVQTVGQFKAAVTLRNLTTGRGPINARSLNGVTTLGARNGHTVRFEASGDDAASVLSALKTLADNNFGDSPIAPAGNANAPIASPAASTAPAGTLHGIGASGGIGIGTAVRASRSRLRVESTPSTDPAGEWRSFQAAADQVRAEIRATLRQVRQQTNAATAKIFEAHLLILDDPLLIDAVRAGIERDQATAASAWAAATDRLQADYRALPDPYMQARAADVEDVSQQVLAELLGQPPAHLTIDQPGILIATDLLPAEAAALSPKDVLAIGLAEGSATSHSAILARSLGIPAVVGLGNAILSVSNGTTLIVDGDAGLVTIAPLASVEARGRARQAEQAAARESARRESAQPAITRDGRRIEIAANIGVVADAHIAAERGAEGVGLFRTEFLFLDRQTEPSEAEQVDAYRGACAALAPRPVIIRTLDVGGDKPLPYIDQGTEANPFLGQRALRLCLARPALFRTQLRAILRTAAEYPVRIMFPMVALPSEVRAAREHVEAAARELIAEGLALQSLPSIGIMVEIPAAAVQVEHFTDLVDFFSIGTNDLTQYTMAAERGNPALDYLADALHPAVLNLIGQVCKGAHAAGKWVGVCGELAGDPAAIPILVGLGVDELSMNSPAIPTAKQIVRNLTIPDSEAIARRALALADAVAVRALTIR